MIVRLARLTDISNTLAFCKDEMGKTNYAAFPFNAVIARRTLKAAMTTPGMRVWVSEKNGKITGVLVGDISPMPFSHYLSATDIAFVATAGGDKLLAAYIAWCRLNKVARLDLGMSAMVNRKGVDRMLRRHGLEVAGGLYYMNMLSEVSQ